MKLNINVQLIINSTKDKAVKYTDAMNLGSQMNKINLKEDVIHVKRQ